MLPRRSLLARYRVTYIDPTHQVVLIDQYLTMYRADLMHGSILCAPMRTGSLEISTHLRVKSHFRVRVTSSPAGWQAGHRAHAPILAAHNLGVQRTASFRNVVPYLSTFAPHAHPSGYVDLANSTASSRRDQ
jgi:hypothetical protein